jgi:hypothetical protein
VLAGRRIDAEVRVWHYDFSGNDEEILISKNSENK